MTYTFFFPEYPCLEVVSTNERQARALARFALGMEKLPKGTLVVTSVA